MDLSRLSNETGYMYCPNLLQDTKLYTWPSTRTNRQNISYSKCTYASCNIKRGTVPLLSGWRMKLSRPSLCTNLLNGLKIRLCTCKQRCVHCVFNSVNTFNTNTYKKNYFIYKYAQSEEKLHIVVERFKNLWKQYYHVHTTHSLLRA